MYNIPRQLKLIEIPESFKDPVVRLDIYQQLLNIMFFNKERTDVKRRAYMCQRLLDIDHWAIPELKGIFVTGCSSTTIPNYIPLRTLLPELEPPCLTGPAAWGPPYDYDLRIKILNKAIEKIKIICAQ